MNNKVNIKITYCDDKYIKNECLQESFFNNQENLYEEIKVENLIIEHEENNQAKCLFASKEQIFIQNKAIVVFIDNNDENPRYKLLFAGRCKSFEKKYNANYEICTIKAISLIESYNYKLQDFYSTNKYHINTKNINKTHDAIGLQSELSKNAPINTKINRNGTITFGNYTELDDINGEIFQIKTSDVTQYSQKTKSEGFHTVKAKITINKETFIDADVVDISKIINQDKKISLLSEFINWPTENSIGNNFSIINSSIKNIFEQNINIAGEFFTKKTYDMNLQILFSYLQKTAVKLTLNMSPQLKYSFNTEKILNFHIKTPTIITWEPHTHYLTHDIVLFNNKIYQAIENHTSVESFQNDIWHPKPLTNNTEYKNGDIVEYSDEIYLCTNDCIIQNENQRNLNANNNWKKLIMQNINCEINKHNLEYIIEAMKRYCDKELRVFKREFTMDFFHQIDSVNHESNKNNLYAYDIAIGSIVSFANESKKFPKSAKIISIKINITNQSSNITFVTASSVQISKNDQLSSQIINQNKMNVVDFKDIKYKTAIQNNTKNTDDNFEFSEETMDVLEGEYNEMKYKIYTNKNKIISISELLKIKIINDIDAQINKIKEIINNNDENNADNQKVEIMKYLKENNTKIEIYFPNLNELITVISKGENIKYIHKNTNGFIGEQQEEL